MLKQGLLPNPTILHYNIKSLINLQQADRAYRLLEVMNKKNVYPYINTYNMLILELSKNNDSLIQIEFLYDVAIKRYGRDFLFDLNEITYNNNNEGDESSDKIENFDSLLFKKSSLNIAAMRSGWLIRNQLFDKLYSHILQCELYLSSTDNMNSSSCDKDIQDANKSLLFRIHNALVCTLAEKVSY